MGLFDFFKPKRKIEPTKEVVKVPMPEYNETLMFLDMVRGRKVGDLFSYGATMLIQKSKHEYLTNQLTKAIDAGWFEITSGEKSIEQSYSKKLLVEACVSLNIPISGNKIDLVKRILKADPLYFNNKDINNWILATEIGKEKIKEYQDKFNSDYDYLQQTIYNLLLNDKHHESLKLLEIYRLRYPFDKRDGFFITFSIPDLKQKIKEIRSTSVFDKIGFPKIYGNAFKTLLCMYYMFGDVILEEKFEEVMPGSVELLKRSKFIKNKDVPFVDLKNLLEGREVRKYPVI